ncbi:MAG TPA: hypothetical protein VMZ91_00495 [Candidatus Paceibacterota bacterium]|nr:hypothetical protein [Candidatus Paceibacterota bacterium]
MKDKITRKDLNKEIKDIEKRIAEVCQDYSVLLGREVGWSDVREFVNK